jgi:hypothetical protein
MSRVWESISGDGRVCDIDKSQPFDRTIKEEGIGKAEISINEELLGSESCVSHRKSPRKKQAVDTIVGAGSWILEDEGALSALDPELFFEISPDARSDDEEIFQFDPGWQPCLRSHAGQSSSKEPGSDNNTSSNRSSSDSNGSGSSPSKGDGRNQKRLYRGERTLSDGNGDQDEDQDQSKKPKIGKSLEKRFACPFWKNNPQFYKASPETRKKYMVCASGMGFTDIARLKYVGS